LFYGIIRKNRKRGTPYSPENSFSDYDSANATRDDSILICDVLFQEERKANGRLVAVIVCFLGMLRGFELSRTFLTQIHR